MSKNLVIVESPAKAKTIEKYLGKDYHVLSSVGHIRSIAKKTKDGTPPIDVAKNFNTIYDLIVRLKPTSAKGTYIKNIAVSSTMGPAIKVQTTK